MENPLVSIVIPVYNREKLLEPCIESALAQTYRNIEVIVVDNQSTDSTWATCQRYAAMDNRVRIFQNETNVGPVRNWQRALKEANGTYANILFSDDFLYPNHIETLLPHLADPRIALAWSTPLIGETPETGELHWRWKAKTGIYLSKSFIRDALFNGKVPVTPVPALFRLADLQNNLTYNIDSPTIDSFASTGAGPDQLLYLLTLAAYPNLAYIDHPTCFLRGHADGITSQKHALVMHSYKQARIWFAQHLLDQSLIDQAFGAIWVGAMRKKKGWISPKVLRAEFLVPTSRKPNSFLALFYGIYLGSLIHALKRK